MNHLTPIIDMTKNCNMACKYCYAGCAEGGSVAYEQINEAFRSSISSLCEFIDQVMCYNENTQTAFIFHGGEPLLINPDNWAHILDFFKGRNYPFEVQVQTNGTLINEEFISLFKALNVKIGVSLDGPNSLNDKTRVFKGGQGSFLRIFENLQRMKEAGLSFGCLVTLNKTNLDVEAIYDFFKKYNIPFNVRPVSDTKYSVPREILITPNEYASSLCKLFDLWFDDETQPPLINDFDNIVARFIKRLERLTTCTFSKNCSKSFIGFEMEGNLWPCNCLKNIDFHYGNIREKDLASILSDPKVKELSNRWYKLSRTECKGCEVSKYCYGGCPSRAYDYYGSYFRKDPFCEAYRTILTHVYGRIKSSLGVSKYGMG